MSANRGAAGVDGQTLAQFDEDLKSNLYRIWNRMSSGSYMPTRVRRVDIPKSDGRTRPLGVPTVADRIAQMVVKRRLEPGLEAVFHEDSYGYRPGRSAHQALGMARRRCWDKDWVLDLDIKGFFDNIDHELMMRAVRRHTNSTWERLYIERWLKAGVQMPDGSVVDSDKGTPQGGVISPLLANLYLHYAFDVWIRKHYPRIEFERYADDVICHCHSQAQATELWRALTQRMQECKLELHPQKTQIAYCRDGKRRGDYAQGQFDFLGYTFKPRRAITRRGRLFTNFAPGVSDAAGKAMRQTMRRWQVARRSDLDLQTMAKWMEPRLKGWVQYYGRYNKSALGSALRSLDYALMRWAQRKYKRLKRERVGVRSCNQTNYGQGARDRSCFHTLTRRSRRSSGGAQCIRQAKGARKAGAGLRVGKGVFHTQLGEGVLLTLEGKGPDARAQVNFGRHGVKWLQLSITKLIPID